MPGATTLILEYLGHVHYMILMLLLRSLGLYAAKKSPLICIGLLAEESA